MNLGIDLETISAQYQKLTIKMDEGMVMSLGTSLSRSRLQSIQVCICTYIISLTLTPAHKAVMIIMKEMVTYFTGEPPRSCDLTRSETIAICYTA